MKPIKYVRSILTFYLRGEIGADANFLSLKVPNTILGLIPCGSKREKIAVNQIASVSSNYKMRFGKFLFSIVLLVLAGVLTFISLDEMDEPLISAILFLLLFLIALNTFCNAFETDLTVTLTSGQEKRIRFFAFDRGKAKRAEDLINAMISGRMDDTNNRIQADKIVDAIKGLKN